jgi:hypothetical protein
LEATAAGAGEAESSRQKDGDRKILDSRHFSVNATTVRAEYAVIPYFFVLVLSHRRYSYSTRPWAFEYHFIEYEKRKVLVVISEKCPIRTYFCLDVSVSIFDAVVLCHGWRWRATTFFSEGTTEETEAPPA